MDYKHYPYTAGDLKVVTPFDAVTGDDISDAFDISGAKAVCIEFTEAGTVNNRQADLTITVSTDGTTFRAYAMLIDDVANSNGQTLTRVVDINRSTAGTDLLWMTPETLAFRQMKVTLDVTDGDAPTGTFTVKVSIVR